MRGLQFGDRWDHIRDVALRRGPRIGYLASTGSVIALGAILITASALWTDTPGSDYRIYMDRATDFVQGRGLYLPHQLAGPYVIANGDSLYPPTILVLILPFLVLPTWLWWVLPLGIVTLGCISWRPKWWAWLPIAVLAVYPPTLAAVLKGNPAIWLAAGLTLATHWRPAAVLVLLKPSLALFALFRCTRRPWWIAFALGGAVSLLLLPLWGQWLAAMLNIRGSTALYSLEQVPLMLIPVLAWAARRADRGSPERLARSPTVTRIL